MPEDVRLSLISRRLGMIAQAGQYNLPRMLKRDDGPAAMASIHEFAQATVSLVFLINNPASVGYAPYYKWRFAALRRLSARMATRLAGVCTQLEDVLELASAACFAGAGSTDHANARAGSATDSATASPADRIQTIIEGICAEIVAELRREGLTESDETFPGMAAPVRRGAYRLRRAVPAQSVSVTMQTNGISDGTANGTRDDLVETIVRMEWDAFQRTTNMGGRAACQGNWPVFHQMRASQFLTWPENLLASYRDDLKDAEYVGRNLVTEKYARMMRSTHPDEYAATIEPYIPALSAAREAEQEAIIATQVAWAREFRERYRSWARPCACSPPRRIRLMPHRSKRISVANWALIRSVRSICMGISWHDWLPSIAISRRRQSGTRSGSRDSRAWMRRNTRSRRGNPAKRRT